jgi:hypothetical protein
MDLAIAELSEAMQTRQQWQRLSESAATPKAIAGIQTCDQNHQAAQANLHSLEAICKSSLQELELAEISVRVSALSSDKTTPYPPPL